MHPCFPESKLPLLNLIPTTSNSSNSNSAPSKLPIVTPNNVSPPFLTSKSSHVTASFMALIVLLSIFVKNLAYSMDLFKLVSETDG